jgi:hypothetical protein
MMDQSIVALYLCEAVLVQRSVNSKIDQIGSDRCTIEEIRRAPEDGSGVW